MRTIVSTVIAVVGVALLLAGCGRDTPGAEERDAAPQAMPVILEDSRPSGTVRDWTTYADFVAVIEPVAEERAPEPPDQEDPGFGEVRRALELQVGDVLWVHPEARRSPPKRFRYWALGWMWRDDPDNLVEPVSRESPRLEIGHRYVAAFFWTPRRCYRNDRGYPADWENLGADAVLPYDDEVLGVGELAGEHRDLTEAEEAASSQFPNGVIAQMTGEPIDVLRTMLTSSTPRRDPSYDDPDGTCVSDDR